MMMKHLPLLPLRLWLGLVVLTAALYIGTAQGHGTLTPVEQTLEGVHVTLNVSPGGLGYVLVSTCRACTSSASLTINAETRYFVDNSEVTAERFDPAASDVVTVFYRPDTGVVSRIKVNSR